MTPACLGPELHTLEPLQADTPILLAVSGRRAVSHAERRLRTLLSIGDDLAAVALHPVVPLPAEHRTSSASSEACRRARKLSRHGQTAELAWEGRGGAVPPSAASEFAK